MIKVYILVYLKILHQLLRLHRASIVNWMSKELAVVYHKLLFQNLARVTEETHKKKIYFHAEIRIGPF